MGRGQWAAGNRQFGFCRRCSAGQALFVLRTLQDQHWRHGKKLWVFFVDFKQASQSVRRDLLWQKLAACGLGCEWLAAVQALYADVPMAVCAAALPLSGHAWTEAGLPPEPPSLGLYIVDLPAEVLAAAALSEQLDLPTLAVGGEALLPLLYADYMDLLATHRKGCRPSSICCTATSSATASGGVSP